ncbi:MAG: anhydro-N-acetylmuramic acid kinase [Bryobacterales bacterium]|nr:anhydro-N-acetylmuramic acid kinase [Bryobacterales bacterium]MBV9401118.1 anhydro-N-acetylmuramic acid kinase [Bryobacterales bacterium]
MKIAGIMSGTSLDGIDVAIVEIGRGGNVKPVAFRSFPYPNAVREALLAISNANTHTSSISRLNFLLGELYAEALIAAARRAKIPLEEIAAVGMHGQTIFHEGTPVKYLGRCIASTLQIGEAAVVAERTGVEVISNFRERDIAAGGAGAPLVPLVDYLLFRHRTICRAVVNIGGIANVTILPRNPRSDQVIAFDTGPGNMVIDALVARYTHGGQTYDRNGRIARSAKVNDGLRASLMDSPYFERKPPKTAGREQFGREFVDRLIATEIPLPDLIATATDLTAVTIGRAILRNTTYDDVQIIVSGGGVHNGYLMQRLKYYVSPWTVRSALEFGIDPDAKEAIAFAVLAYRRLTGKPGNVPSATGARRPVRLGKATPA